jgi:hypothetical protein
VSQDSSKALEKTGAQYWYRVHTGDVPENPIGYTRLVHSTRRSGAAARVTSRLATGCATAADMATSVSTLGHRVRHFCVRAVAPTKPADRAGM